MGFTPLPMGYKWTSETFTIRGEATETAANTFTEAEINLNLDSLSREILVIQRVDLDCGNPTGVAGTNTSVSASLANSAQTAVIGINNPDCIASAQKVIVSANPTSAVAFSEEHPESINNSDEALYIVATDNLFLGIVGLANTAAKNVRMVLHARRAKADASTYSAILTSQFA